MTETNTENSTTRDAHLQAFGRLAPGLPGHGIDWLDSLRRDALGRFEDTGMPHRRLEAWKFTGLDLLTKHAFSPVHDGADAAAPKLDFGPEDCAARLVFVDGRLDDAQSMRPDLAEGITVSTLAEALERSPGLMEQHLSAADGAAGALWDLNAAFMADGAVVQLQEGAKLERPISLVFLSSGATNSASHVRNLVALGAGAEATVIETYGEPSGGQAAAFTNAVTDVSLDEGATLTHVRVQELGPNAVHTARAVVEIGRGAHYGSFALAMGAALSRQETDATFTGPDGAVRLMGAYLGRGRQHLDHTTRIDHAQPRCSTDELFKGVLDDRAHGVFQGLVRVAPKAIGTDARQKNQALLLSDRAVADTKPELEILADDVKCAHGATVGDIDADELFYLMARGLSEAGARRLLIGGFIGDVIDRFDQGAVARYLSACVDRWQARGDGGFDD
jgi:Fe-S cluster assembly protein SufD